MKVGVHQESGKWVHARYTDMKKVKVYLNENFVCNKSRSVVKNIKRPDEILRAKEI